MSFNSLSLRYPEEDITLIPVSSTPVSSTPTDNPSDYIPSSSQHSVRRVRAPRRCSCCRQTGHDARRCPVSAAVHFRGQTFNMYDNPRDNLIQFVISYFVQRVPQLSSFPSIYEKLYEDMFYLVSLMTYNELKRVLRNPVSAIDYGRERLQLAIDNHRIVQASRQFVQASRQFVQASRQFVPRSPPGPPPSAQPRAPRKTGKDYAQNIEIELEASENESSECFICCDQLCSVKTSCGHEYCVKCVAKIIHVNKDKTTAPACSFCKAPFSKFTVSTAFAETKLSSFIKKLA